MGLDVSCAIACSSDSWAGSKSSELRLVPSSNVESASPRTKIVTSAADAANIASEINVAFGPAEAEAPCDMENERPLTFKSEKASGRSGTGNCPLSCA